MVGDHNVFIFLPRLNPSNNTAQSGFNGRTQTLLLSQLQRAFIACVVGADRAPSSLQKSPRSKFEHQIYYNLYTTCHGAPAAADYLSTPSGEIFAMKRSQRPSSWVAPHGSAKCASRTFPWRYVTAATDFSFLASRFPRAFEVYIQIADTDRRWRARSRKTPWNQSGKRRSDDMGDLTQSGNEKHISLQHLTKLYAHELIHECLCHSLEACQLPPSVGSMPHIAINRPTVRPPPTPLAARKPNTFMRKKPVGWIYKVGRKESGLRIH
ncbi:hypothetical protein DM02DRAFT_630186 [Periconia macrospinosa]|uniref:Uncharacterized protein n=1 Tax=Periconia macrospinosa TaxID=97972 RepID=A0A2V1DJX4_9PLEO|nr:hypothetical protein DM02DRAFT_630186 [Periconia macrospinosa]